MRYRPFDETGDMIPIQTASQMLEDSDAVAAAVKSRVELGIGEWWEDETLGFEVPEFLFEGIRGDDGCAMLVNYIVAYIVKTEGVASLANYSYRRNRRNLTASIAVTTIYGDEIEGSVDLNELQAALSR